ncbi:MAG: esterase-like activity of phytase family protein [Deltaproteobacteria bacterium]|jgi:DNA-binding beta-propeller fold protein YncE|nr:esterase-like activity of phytase family protein [Deltaproteobacteria bacterium]
MIKNSLLPFCLFCFLLFSSAGASAHVQSFNLESHYAVPGGGVAEIVTGTPDGLFLYYTNASGSKVGLLDISDPKKPITGTDISIGEAEPTSASVTGDGKYLVVAARNGDGLDKPTPGSLFIYDIADRASPRLLGQVEIGIGPDCVALAERDGKVAAVVAIEDEETDSEGEATIDGKRAGRVDVVTLNFENPSASKVSSVEFPKATLDAVSGVNFTADPQPEFVAIHPNQLEFAVTLQENNAVAIVDIENFESPKIKTVFSAGTAEREADLQKDGKIQFTEAYKGRREPDGIAYVTAGNEVYLALANEGDSSLKTFGDNVYSGGRGVSLHKLDGTPVWDSGLELESAASLLGHYPDSRSNSRSLEVEGVTGGRLFDDDLMIAVSERGSFIAVYRVNDPKKPELLGLLPTGISPEGVTVLAGRADGKKLIVTANEGDGTVNVYSVSDGPATVDPNSPAISSKAFPWSALSGFTTDGRDIYSVPDNARSPSIIWKLDMKDAKNGLVEISEEIPLKKDGVPAEYDLEGICWTKEGFWLVSEGADSAGNLLVFAGLDGTVKTEYPLPSEFFSKYGDSKNYGFEGVTVAPDGKIYAAFQRGFVLDGPDAAILRFDPASKQWETAWYPLEVHSKDPKKFWMGLSDITALDDGRLLIVERDKGMGGTAEVKRIYSFDSKDFANEKKLEKKLVYDILKENNLLLEKVESLCVLNGDMWIAIDNDGAGWTRMLNLGPVPKQ